MTEPKPNPADMRHIKGWGIDADPDNDPTYPLQQRENTGHATNSSQPIQQPVDYEVLRSVERQGMPAVHGTAVPPSALSGMVRRFAFKYGEGKFSHWLPLILADRINAVEGIVHDIRRGRLPNIFAEKGIKAQWQYNRPAVVKRAVTATVVIGGIVWWFTRHKTPKS